MPSGRVQKAVSKILDAIVSGEFQVGSALPPEAELAEWLAVARPTMREAVRILTERGVLDVVHGRGTFVVEPLKWKDLSTIIWWLSQVSSPRELGIYLSEVRRMIEVGACGLAAERRSEEDLESLRQALVDYDRAVETNDIEGATTADLRFHEAILTASGNPFVAAVMGPLADALHDSRLETTSIPEMRERARFHHFEILDMLEKGDVQGSKDAMRAHMTQTRHDILTHFPK